MSCKELVGRDVILTKLRTNIRLRKASPDLVPITRIRHVIPQPRRELFQAVLLIASAGNDVRPVGSGNDKREDEEHEKQTDEKSHTEEVYGKETLPVPISADESS